jgi:ketosteroid isomerase-like protein
MSRLFALMILAGMAMPAFADLEADVRCREIGFSKSVETLDIERFASFIDPDARFVSGAVMRGPEAISAAWSVFFEADAPLIVWRPKYVEVLEDGKLALTRGPYRMVTRDEDGKETEQWGTFNSVWRLNADGEWRVVFDAGGVLPAPPPPEDQALLGAPDSGGSE